MFIPPSTANNFSTWQSNTGYDLHSKSSFVNWTLPVSNDTLLMNQIDNVVTISLGPNEFLDLDSNIVCSSILLQSYTSKILINTNNICSTTGIDENNTEKDLFIFPNPFSSTTTLQTDNIFKDATLTVYNLQGQQVKQIKNISGKTVTLHRDYLPMGLYFIHLTQDNKTITTDKLIITNL